MDIELSEDQRNAVKRMHNGCILCGATGTGKSRTALAYYYILFGGDYARSNNRIRRKERIRNTEISNG